MTVLNTLEKQRKQLCVFVEIKKVCLCGCAYVHVCCFVKGNHRCFNFTEIYKTFDKNRVQTHHILLVLGGWLAWPSLAFLVSLYEI